MLFRSILLIAGAATACLAQPKITAITNAATFTGAIAPGSLAAIFGTGLATGTEQYSSFPLPITLAGALVTINGIPCPLLYARPDFIDFQVPYTIAPGNVNLVVTVGSTPGTPVPLTILPAAPAIFPEAGGRAAARNEDATINTADNPATVGAALVAYFTGIGAVSPAGVTGGVTPGAASSTLSYSATIGGLNAPVAYLGLTPTTTSGLAQANLTVPTLPSGDYPLVITVGGAASLSAIVSIRGSGSAPTPVLSLVGSASVPLNSLQALTGGVLSVAVSGPNAYVCDEAKITIINVSNSSSPQVLNSFGQSDLSGGGSQCALSQNNLVELITNSRIVTYSLGNPTQPQRVGSTNLQFPFVCPGLGGYFGSNVLFPTCHLMYFLGSGQIFQQGGEVEVYSLSDPTNPKLLSTLPATARFPGNDNNSPRFASWVINNQTAAILGTTSTGGDTNGGSAQFTMIDVTDPANMSYLTQAMIPQATVLNGIAVQGNVGLILGNTKGWKNPAGTDPVTNGPAFPLTGNLTLTTVDFANPKNPSVFNTSVTGIQTWGLPMVTPLGSGFFAVLLTPTQNDLHGPSTLAVVDVRNPQSPLLTPVATLAGANDGMIAAGGKLYVATALGLNIYQISTP